MYFSEAYFKYKNLINESIFNRVRNCRPKDFDKTAEECVDKIRKFLNDFKLYLQKEGEEYEGTYKVEIPGLVFFESDGVEYSSVSVNVETGYIDGMYTYSFIKLPLHKWKIYLEFVDEDYSSSIDVDWENLECDEKNVIINYLNFTDFKYSLNESVFNSIKKAKKNDLDKTADGSLSGFVYTVYGIAEKYTIHCTGIVDESVVSQISENIRKNVETIHFFGRINTIGKNAFRNFHRLKEIELPMVLRRIEDDAFNSTAISHIELPNSLEYIGTRAFDYTKLTEVEIPVSVKFIGSQAFYTESLKKIVLNSINLDIRRMVAPSCCQVILKGFKNPPEDDFSNDMEIEFEDKIVEELFYDNLVEKEEDVPYTITDAKNTIKDGFGKDFPLDENNDSVWKASDIKKFNELRYFQNIERLPDYCFADCDLMREISLPNRVREIGDSAFVNCVNLNTVKLPKTGFLKIIGESAFANTGLEKIVLPEGVVEIGDYAFSDCEYLKTVVLPSTLQKIGKCAFSNCTKLSEVQGLDNVKEFGTDVFWECSSLIRNLPEELRPTVYTETTFIDFSWIGDSEKTRDEFLENYCSNYYNTDDLDSLEDNEDWQKDEMNPYSENFDENSFYSQMCDYCSDICQDQWNYFLRCSNLSKFDGYGWCVEDGSETFSTLRDAIEFCVGDGVEWEELTITSEEGGLNVCGQMIYPITDRNNFQDDIDGNIDEDYIDYSSRRWTDRVNVRL